MFDRLETLLIFIFVIYIYLSTIGSMRFALSGMADMLTLESAA